MSSRLNGTLVIENIIFFVLLQTENGYVSPLT